MVEGGRIDQAHHEGWAQRALNETIALDDAIEKTLSKINSSETLVIVTADHSHSMTFSGYVERGSDVTGKLFKLCNIILPIAEVLSIKISSC